MMVEIDSGSGFCGGVIRAIGTAENYLKEHQEPLYSLGAIVHNEQELARLESLGLKTVENLNAVPDSVPLLIRAHGEPPKLYAQAARSGHHIIDCTCPVVLKLQRDIREAYGRVSTIGGSIVIYGKDGHPEVLGLVGQVEAEVLVVSSIERLQALVESGELRTDRNIELFSQTTMSPDGYRSVSAFLEENMLSGAQLTVHHTICSQVASRHQQLSEFARTHDVIIFVAGKASSNGKVLSNWCRQENSRTHLVGSVTDLKASWFSPKDSVGICGATSTPAWLLETIAEAVKNLL